MLSLMERGLQELGLGLTSILDSGYGRCVTFRVHILDSWDMYPIVIENTCPCTHQSRMGIWSAEIED